MRALFFILLRKECLLGVRLGFLEAVGDNDVVKHSSCRYLPNLESNMRTSGLAYFVQLWIVDKVRVINHGVLPLALVVGVGNHLRLPCSFVIWVVDHRGFPFTIVFIVPILWLRCLGISNLLGNVVITFWF